LSAWSSRTALLLLACFTAWILSIALPAFAQSGGMAAVAKERMADAAADAPAAGKPSVPLTAAPSATGAASSGTSEPAPSRVATVPLPIKEVGPDLLYLKDKDGHLQAVPGFTLEDFVRLYKQQQQLAAEARPPRFQFGKATVTGSVAQSKAELNVEMTIDTTDSDWVRIPLGLAPALLTESPKYTGAGQHVVEYDAASEGYVLWLKGGAPPAASQTVRETHMLTFQHVVVPLAATGEPSRLRLALPRSLAVAQFEIRVPTANARVTTNASAVVATKSLGEEGTLVTLSARGGDVELAWRGEDRMASPMPRIVESAAAIRATIDNRSVTWETQLTLRGASEPIEQFDVRLPPGAELESTPASGYSLSTTTRSPRVVTVSLLKPARETFTLRLLARRTREAAATDNLELAGFEVLGAARQSGAIAVVVNGDLRATWAQRRDVRDLDAVPESLSSTDDQQATAFEFYAQPFSLPVSVSPQPTRLDVEPAYLVGVEGERLTLQGRLRYKVRGAKVSQLQLGLAGWTIDDLGPPGLVQASGATSGDDGTLSIALAQRMRSGFELTFTAHRTATDSNQVDFMLPRVVADVVAPPLLLVDAADNVELLPREKDLVALRYQSAEAAADFKPPKRKRPPLVFRATGDGAQSRFVADMRIRQRTISSDIATDVRIDRAGLDTPTTADDAAGVLEQHIELSVAYEPLAQILLEMPRELATRRDVTYLLDDQPTLPVVLAPLAAAPRNDLLVRVLLEPAAPITDKARITIRYPLLDAQVTSAAARFVLPLVMPADEHVASNTVSVHAPRGASITSPSDAWSMQTSDESSASTARFAADERQFELDLSIKLPPRRTSVELAWLRSALASDTRQDRAVFRVRSDESKLRFVLPEGVRSDRLAVWLDSRQQSPQLLTSDAGMMLEVDLAAGARAAKATAKSSTIDLPASTHVVELLYNLDAAGGLLARRQWQRPYLAGDVWEMRALWQVVLPAGEHIVVEPPGYTAENQWSWQPAFHWGETALLSYWGRRPNLDTAELQRLSGATGALPLDGDVNAYLFSASGAPQPLAFQTMSRSLIVLIASAAVIMLGLLLLYYAPARQPAVLLLLVVVVAAVAVVSPATAALAAQAAALGVALALLAAAGSWWFTAKRRPISHAPSNLSDRLERGSGTSRRDARQDRSRATTLTAPAELGATADLNS
jgi:hypothetical protein